MGLFDFLSGSPPEKHEQKADAYVIDRAYGHAKIEYEKALEKIKRQPGSRSGYCSAIEDKLRRCRESLAREHHETGKALVKAGCPDDARELFDLALELTSDDRLSADIRHQRDTLSNTGGSAADYEFHDEAPAPAPGDQAPFDPGSDDEYFEALCNALEEAEQEAYLGYPDTFKSGFVALNQGDFDTAVALLSEAAKAYPFGANYIFLELATAHLNRGEHETARSLLESFLQEFPENLRAYYLLCDLFWETGDFDAADRLLSNSPPELAATLPVRMLAGETLLRSQQFDKAAAFYNELLETNGWEPLVAQALAGALEALGRTDEARQLYAEIMGDCTGCGTRVDPVVKQRYAETSFAGGDHSTRILELYLDLVREDPANRRNYYHRISQLYSRQGNPTESRRFAAFAQRAEKEDR